MMRSICAWLLGIAAAFACPPAVRAQITIAIDAPTPGGEAAQHLAVSATITSLYELSSVSATIGTRSAALLQSAPGTYSGIVDMNGESRGAKTLVLTAHD